MSEEEKPIVPATGDVVERSFGAADRPVTPAPQPAPIIVQSVQEEPAATSESSQS